jgi:hypothetical protein
VINCRNSMENQLDFAVAKITLPFYTLVEADTLRYNPFMLVFFMIFA